VAVADALFMAFFTQGCRIKKKSFAKTNNGDALKALNNPIPRWIAVMKGRHGHEIPVEYRPYEPT
jgi:ribosomal protein L39E